MYTFTRDEDAPTHWLLLQGIFSDVVQRECTNVYFDPTLVRFMGWASHLDGGTISFQLSEQESADMLEEGVWIMYSNDTVHQWQTKTDTDGSTQLWIDGTHSVSTPNAN
jgi:hypothetical protein